MPPCSMQNLDEGSETWPGLVGSSISSSIVAVVVALGMRKKPACLKMGAMCDGCCHRDKRTI
jgi:hypothetical protein